MGRKRKGWIRQRGSAWYFGLTLRDGSPYEQKIEAPTGVVIDEKFADKIRAIHLDDYDRGAWDPKAPRPSLITLPMPKQRTVYEFAIEWIDKQTYQTAPHDKEMLVRHLGKSSFGVLSIRDVTPPALLDYINELSKKPSQQGGTLAPRSVRRVYAVLKSMFGYAVFAGVLTVDPCATLAGRLPMIADKHPTARDGWTFSHDEIMQLCTSETLPIEDRVFNALRFFTGARFGELAALRWHDIDYTTHHLPRITIRRARKTYTGQEGSTKTGAVKFVPLHPRLQVFLRQWFEQWPAVMGREVEASDLVLPCTRGPTKGQMRNEDSANQRFKRNCIAVGIRPRHQHCTRHAFISRTQDDGCDGSLIRWITHAPPDSAFDGYTRVQWSRLCQEILKYRALEILADKLAIPDSNNSIKEKQGGNHSMRVITPEPIDALLAKKIQQFPTQQKGDVLASMGKTGDIPATASLSGREHEALLFAAVELMQLDEP